LFEPTITAWAITVGAIAALIAFDLWHARRRSSAPGVRSAAIWSAFYVAVAILFGVVLTAFAGSDLGGQYFAGYVVEKSLSVDNLFVFVIIMGTFAVPAEQQPRVLMAGIVGALLLRAVFIALGAAMLEAFSFTYLLFAIVLIATAVRLFRHRDEGPSVGEIPLLGAIRRRWSLTPRSLALAAIAGTDLMFAFDSIPAVFGVTQHAYIVFAANAFALLGLRALYFLVSGLLERLVYLSAGLALILAFIGAKLGLHFAHLHHASVPEISTGVSLAVIAAVLAATTVASLVSSRRARLDGGRGRGVTGGDVVEVGGDDSAVDEAPPAREPALCVRAPLAAGGRGD
jgi:tellurite resistance protein TerC